MKLLNIIAVIRIALCIALLVTFAFVPVASIANTSFCLIYHLTGAICPGCGSSRALNNIMHLDFERAMVYNPVLTLFIFPAFIIMLVNDIYCLTFRLVKKTVRYSFIEYLFVGLKGV